jgi:hypothetical protein
MTDDISTYSVKCRTCRRRFTVQLFGSHEKNLFLVDKKDWYCETCKQEFTRQQAAKLAEVQASSGFPALQGTPKQIPWAEKIRAELINKLDYLQKSLKYENENQKALSERAFEVFRDAWREKPQAKWWIDQRRMTVRDITQKLAEISAGLEKG